MKSGKASWSNWEAFTFSRPVKSRVLPRKQKGQSKRSENSGIGEICNCKGGRVKKTRKLKDSKQLCSFHTGCKFRFSRHRSSRVQES